MYLFFIYKYLGKSPKVGSVRSMETKGNSMSPKKVNQNTEVKRKEPITRSMKLYKSNMITCASKDLNFANAVASPLSNCSSPVLKYYFYCYTDE